MIKNLLFAGLLFTGFNVFSQAFSALYPFSAVTTTSGATDPTPPPTATGVSFGSFSAVGVGPNSSGGGRFSFNTWGTGATTGVDTYSTMTGSIDLAKYYQVVITPSVGYGVTLTNMPFDVRRSGTGIRNFAVRSSADGYANNLQATVVMSQTVVSVLPGDIFFWNQDAASTAVDQKGCSIIFSGGSFTNFLAPLTLRFYAWNAEAGTGTFSIDTVIINGSATLGAGIGQITHNLNAGFKLYPNPSNDGIVTLEGKHTTTSKIEVLNVLGSVVVTETKETSAEKIRLNLNTLPAGTYFVRFTTGEKVYTERLFITK